jgi:spore germination protein
LTFLLVTAVFLFSLKEIDWTNFLPLLGTKVGDVVWTGVKLGISDYEGYEVFLIILPFMLIPGRAPKAAVLGLGLNLVFRLMILVATVGVFGMHTVDFLWPVGMLAKFVEVPGGIFDRLEVAFMIIWVSVAFSSTMLYNYFASLGLSRLMQFKEQSLFTFALVPLLYIISLIPANEIATEMLTRLEQVLAVSICFATPLLLLGFSWVFGIKDET